MKPRRRAVLLALGAAGVLVLIPTVVLVWAYFAMLRMPLASHRGPVEPLSAHEQEVQAELRAHVTALAGGGPGRNEAMALRLIEGTFSSLGYSVEHQRYSSGGTTGENLVATTVGRMPTSIVVVGAHYDVVPATPGANDNASGVAAMLALAKVFARRTPESTLRFVAFDKEEPPYFQTPAMGSWAYARRCRERGDNIVAMLSLETLGYYEGAEGSQHYPPVLDWFYPTKGNFVGFVGDRSSASLVRRTLRVFREHARFPSEGIAGPAALPGIGWSDQWSFWQEGYPGVMITDTAPFRYERYHQASDTADKLSYPAFAKVVVGLERVIEELAFGT